MDDRVRKCDDLRHHFRARAASFQRLLRVEEGMPSVLATLDWGKLRYSLMSTNLPSLGCTPPASYIRIHHHQSTTILIPSKPPLSPRARTAGLAFLPRDLHADLFLRRGFPGGLLAVRLRPWVGREMSARVCLETKGEAGGGGRWRRSIFLGWCARRPLNVLGDALDGRVRRDLLRQSPCAMRGNLQLLVHLRRLCAPPPPRAMGR